MNSNEKEKKQTNIGFPDLSLKRRPPTGRVQSEATVLFIIPAYIWLIIKFHDWNQWLTPFTNEPKTNKQITSYCFTAN